MVAPSRPHLHINRPALWHAPVSVQPDHRIGQLISSHCTPVVGLPVPVLDAANDLSVTGIAGAPEIAGRCGCISRDAGPLEGNQVIHHGGAQDGVAAVGFTAPQHGPAYLAGVLVPVQDGEAQALPVGCAAVVGHAARPCIGGEGWIRTCDLWRYERPELPLHAYCPCRAFEASKYAAAANSGVSK